jgi:mxaA protein
MQLINTPASIKTWTIPAIQLKFLGTPPAEAAMPSLTIDVAPLNTGEIRTGLPEAMELRRAPLIPLDAHIEAIQRYGAVSLVGLSWFLVTLLLAYRRQRAPHPFRDARRKVLRALHHIDSPEHARAAFILIHRAFDDTWGRRLFRSEVEAFCQAHGADATLQALTEQFFLVSEALFFESPARLPDDKQLKHSLKALLGLWGKIEQKAP